MRARAAASGAVFLAALGAALALKGFYSTASAADLRFVLAPTTCLVEVAGGPRFDWTSGGYLSTELRFLIAPACAGVNFLVVAFSALAPPRCAPPRPRAVHLCVPLLPHAEVMLVVPLLRGAHQRPGFWGRAALVAGALLVVTVVGAALRRGAQLGWSHETRSPRS